jgi:hypothetical protein
LFTAGPWFHVEEGEQGKTIRREVGAVSTEPVFSENTEHVDKILAAIREGRTAGIVLFGESEQWRENYDFSQFKPRGHYTDSLELVRYFRAMMWLGRVDFRLTPGNSAPLSPEEALERSRRHLAAATALAEIVADSGTRDAWQEIESAVAELFGRPDFMTLGEFVDLLGTSDVGPLAELDADGIGELQDALLNGSLGAQQISTHVYEAPLGQPLILPRSMAMFGQRFTMDIWALDTVVFSKIVRDENGIPEETDFVMRRIPSALDVAFSVLGNDSTTPEITNRIKNPHGVKFRDGMPYEHNLAAVRSVIDSQPSEIWSENLYNRWLGTLRTFSEPLPEGVPACTMTEAWAMEDLNTQLVSWTHLRSLTILYVKQSVTEGGICNFPDICIDPRPRFWAALKGMAEKAAQSFGSIGAAEGSAHFVKFASSVGKIETLLDKQLSNVELSPEDRAYIDRLIGEGQPIGCGGGSRLYDGWYPALFYGDPLGSETTDARVTDFHTDLPCDFCGDPGAVVHAGTGGINLLIMVARRNGELTAFAGPVSSFHEFQEPSGTRLTNEEWRKRITSQTIEPPEWTKSYLVPSGRPVQSTPF